MNTAARMKNRKVRTQTEGTLAMTPMIDVVFQMLIYFVLTFEVPDRMSRMSVWRPSAPPPRAPSPQLPIVIGINQGTYIWNQQPASLSELENLFHRMADLDPGQNVVLVTSARSRHHELVRILDLLNKTGLEKISLLSTNE